jgi:ankyrin repeat protein
MQLENFPLASYAAEHWVSHAKYGVISPDILAGMKCLFDKDKPHFNAWIWLYNVDKQSPESTIHPTQPDAVPLYYAALCGFRDTAEHLVRAHPEDVNARGGNHVTPLHAALLKGHLDVALLLLQNGANVGSRGIEGQTPLHIASDRGYIDIVKSLIDNHGADPNPENDGQETPLLLASKSGHEEVVNLLLASAQTRITRTGMAGVHCMLHRKRGTIISSSFYSTRAACRMSTYRISTTTRQCI